MALKTDDDGRETFAKLLFKNTAVAVAATATTTAADELIYS